MENGELKTENRKLKKYRLGEIGDIITGKTPSTFDIENYGEEYMFISPTDLHNGYKIEKTLKNISQKGFDSIKTNTIKGQSVLVGCIGWDMGNVGYTEKKCATNQQINSITNFKEFANPLYTYYWLKNKKDFLFSVASVTRTPILNKSSFSDIVIPLPELQNQMDVAKILSSLDDKIALNRRMNAKLEQMAKRLYDHWFVQFDFPNADGKPYKSSGGKMEYNEVLKREIPAGWKISNVCKVADILSGGTPSKANYNFWNGNIPFFGPTDYTGDMFQLSTAEKITQEGLDHCASSLFDENTIIITARGSVGKLVIVGNPMAMNQSCYALKSKNRNQYEYLYFLTIQLIESLKVKSSGSVFKSIITSDIENSFLIIADSAIIDSFCEKVKPLFLQIKENSKEPQKLTVLRDRLLPLLMNGQVEVK